MHWSCEVTNRLLILVRLLGVILLVLVLYHVILLLQFVRLVYLDCRLVQPLCHLHTEQMMPDLKSSWVLLVNFYRLLFEN